MKLRGARKPARVFPPLIRRKTRTRVRASWRLIRKKAIQTAITPPLKAVKIRASSIKSGVRYCSKRDFSTTSAPADAEYKADKASAWARIKAPKAASFLKDAIIGRKSKAAAQDANTKRYTPGTRAGGFLPAGSEAFFKDGAIIQVKAAAVRVKNATPHAV
jgi:hypothetical protein